MPFPLFSSFNTGCAARRLSALLLCFALRPSPASADEPPLALPATQTFDALDAALTRLSETAKTASPQKDIENARRSVAQGKLLLLAGRVREAALIAEQVRAQIDIIHLDRAIASLRQQATKNRAALKQEQLLLDKLKRRLAEAQAAEADRNPSDRQRGKK